MMKFDHLILDRLLNRYENSAHYRQTAATSRRVLLRLGPESRDLPEYDIENLESRLTAHIAVKQLAAAGFVGYEWARYQQDNVLASVWLILDRVDAAYAWLGRMPGAEIAQAVLGQINSLLDSLSAAVSDDSLAAMNRVWVQPALLTMQARIGSTLKLTPLLPDNFQLAGELLQTLSRITQTGFTETAMRVFSSQCFQDSKYFEKNLRSRLIALMRRFHPQLADQESDEHLPDDDVLRLTGIFRNPEIFEFCGPLAISFVGPERKRSVIDFSVFSTGASLRSSTLTSLADIDASRIHRLLFIENRTNYEAYIQKEIQPAELVVYHGGFHGIAKQRFFKLIVSALPDSVPVEHWGDIDLGGFKIFQQICRNIAPQLRPWRMDRQTLLEHQDCATAFSSTYRKELEKALADPSFAEFAIVLETMLELGLRLEQESLL